MDYSIRKLSGADVAAYRAVRHEALVNHPTSYGSSAESFAALGDDELRDTLDRMTFFGVLAEESLGGIVAFGQTQGERERHRGWLYQVYVQPRLRGTGAASALIEGRSSMPAHGRCRFTWASPPKTSRQSGCTKKPALKSTGLSLGPFS